MRQLGMTNAWRIAGWQHQAAAPPKEPGLALVRIDTAGVASMSAVVLVTPRGFRIEGLAFEELRALLREFA